MSKLKTCYICQNCGYEMLKWVGRCPECNKWNTMMEEQKSVDNKGNSFKDGVISPPVLLKNICLDDNDRCSTGFAELDRVIGGGVVPGSLILVGGDPGIGKSTLLLQVCDKLSLDKKVLYVSGEESEKQIKLRAERLGVKGKNLLLVSETNLSVMDRHIKETNPDFLMIDSIQTMYKPDIPSTPGSVTQVREVTASLMHYAKSMNKAVFIVGHVTKQGAIAGPRVLEHMVDTVLYFEGDRYHTYRIVRAVKNRFGSTNEIGLFEMCQSGLEEVVNPSKVLLAGRAANVSGSAVVCSMEGTRPVLMELQALVSPTGFGLPRRMATGIDYNRVIMLMAVLEKKAGYQLQTQDVYVNIAGGFKIEEPGVDLGIVVAVVSSFKNKPVDPDTVIMGEIGLTGEVRPISNIEKRILECSKMGFKRCILPALNVKQIKTDYNIQIHGVKNVSDLNDIIF